MKRRAAALDGGALSAEVAGLSKASITDLRERWKTLYGKEPSGHIGRSFLIRAIAYRIQEEAFGGLKPSTQRILDRVCDGREEIGQGALRNGGPVQGPCRYGSGEASGTGSSYSIMTLPTAVGVTNRFRK